MEQTNEIEKAIYRQPSQPIEKRIEDLLARMTLEEKAAQLGSVWSYQIAEGEKLNRGAAKELLPLGLGQVTRIGGANALSPEEGARLANEIQHFLTTETRLGIPAIIHEECCSGYMARNATCFPQIIGLASTWDPALTEAMAVVVRQQMRAAGAHQGLSPVLDVARDPRWGRVEETFGEDPYLTAAMGTAFVRGLQGEDWGEGVISTAKHFVGYGLSEGGMNWAPALIPPRQLREVYLYPFEAAVKEANLQSVMNGYHELDGVPCGASKALLTDILIDEWGFDGQVVSDYFAIDQLQWSHSVSKNRAESAQIALNAGIDVELPSTNCFGEPLITAVRQGKIAEDLVDRSVRRVLRHKFMLGLFENPFVDAAATNSVFDTPAQRSLARTIAQKSIVLLKNEGSLLPLDKHIGRLAVIGPNANTVRHLLGDYAYPCHIETLMEMTQESENVFNVPIPPSFALDDNFVPIRPVLAAIADAVSPQTVVDYAQGCEVTGTSTAGFAAAVAAAEQADVALLFVGGKSGLTDSCTCGEARDRAEINLPGVQQALVEAVVATGTPVVVVLINGRPLSINWIDAHVPAILEAWLPGEEGAEAVADVLFGEVAPSGKLPITFPRDAGQIPIYYGHKPSGGKSHWKETYVNLSNKPLYPFGFGLSYTTFQLRNLRLDKRQLSAGETVTVSVDITNTGSLPGDEIVQLYVQDVQAGITRPVKELKGFQRVPLAPGEERTVTFTLAANQLGYYDAQMRYILEPGEIRLMLGTSSIDLPLEDKLDIVGELREVSAEKVFFSHSTFE